MLAFLYSVAKDAITGAYAMGQLSRDTWCIGVSWASWDLPHNSPRHIPTQASLSYKTGRFELSVMILLQHNYTRDGIRDPNITKPRQ